MKIEMKDLNVEADTKEVVYRPVVYELNKNLLLINRGKRKDGWFIHFAVFTAVLMLLTSGCSFTWTSPVLPILKTRTEANPLGRAITPIEESIIAGLVPLGAVIGTALFGKLADIFGRKKTLICFSTLQAFSFIAIAFPRDIYFYYVPRLLIGISFGFGITIIPIFVSEITQDHNRGKFGSWVGMFIILGNLYGFVIGPLFSVQIFTLLCAVPTIINAIFFTLFIPESPVYLASKGDRNNAKKSLKKFRDCNSRELEKEMLEIEHILRATNAKRGFKALFKVPVLRKALVISVGINMIQQLSGITAIMGFIGPVFQAAGCGLTGNTSAIIVGVVQVVSVMITSAVVDRLGRKIMLMVSTVSSFIALLVLGLYFYLKDTDYPQVEVLFWLPVACIMLFVVGYACGMGPLPSLVMSEIFPSDSKAVAASISVFCSGVSAVVAVFAFPIVLDFLGVAWCFLGFSIICGFGAVFIYFVVPETRGKSLLEIQKALNS